MLKHSNPGGYNMEGLNPLLAEFITEVGAESIMNQNYPIGSPTGIDAIDFLSMSQQMNTQGHSYLTCGIYNSNVTGWIGETGVGKSTMAQIANASALKNELLMDRQAVELFLDIEKMMENARCFNVSLFDDYAEFAKSFLRIAGVQNNTAEKIYKQFVKFSSLKDNYRSIYLKPHPTCPDLNLHVPSFVVLDPTSRIATENIMDAVEDDQKEKGHIHEDKDIEMGNNTDFMKIGLATKSMVMRIMSSISDKNMPLSFVSHINKKVSIGFADKFLPPFLPGMKQGETLANGKAFSDIAYHIYRLNNGRADRDQQFGGTILGKEKKLIVAKSKTCGEMTELPIYFDFSRGVLNLVTNFTMLSDKKLLIGKGNYSIPGSDVKFTKKNMYFKYYNDTKFAEAFDRASYQAYIQHIHPSAGFSVDDVCEFFAKYRPVGEYSNRLKNNLLPVELKRDNEGAQMIA